MKTKNTRISTSSGYDLFFRGFKGASLNWSGTAQPALDVKEGTGEGIGGGGGSRELPVEDKENFSK